MNDRVRIADLPTSHVIDKDSYLLVERPGVGEGTYKCKLGDIQEATTVEAEVTQVDKVTTIRIKDIRGETTASIVTPTAVIHDNGDNTYTITITDTDGTTESTAVSKVIFDSEPTEGSVNLINSGEIWNIIQDQNTRFTSIEEIQAGHTTAISALENITAGHTTAIASLEAFQTDAESRLQSIEEALKRCLELEAGQSLPQ